MLQAADELLAIMQHHDGITATSKTHIELDYKDKINNISEQIGQRLNNLYNPSNKADTLVC